MSQEPGNVERKIIAGTLVLSAVGILIAVVLMNLKIIGIGQTVTLIGGGIVVLGIVAFVVSLRGKRSRL